MNERRTNQGIVEGINNRLKVIKRNGFGFKVFENFEKREPHLIREILGKSKKSHSQFSIHNQQYLTDCSKGRGSPVAASVL
jgi:hypothetical protein